MRCANNEPSKIISDKHPNTTYNLQFSMMFHLKNLVTEQAVWFTAEKIAFSNTKPSVK